MVLLPARIPEMRDATVAVIDCIPRMLSTSVVLSFRKHMPYQTSRILLSAIVADPDDAADMVALKFLLGHFFLF